MKKVKIVCTMGPACSDAKTLFSMAEAGMDVARFNFSHGSYDDHEKIFHAVRKVEKQRAKPLATMLDTKGPEIRTGELKGESITLQEGQTFSLVSQKIAGNEKEVSVSVPEIFTAVVNGQDIFIDDGVIHLEATKVEPGRIETRVIVGGILGERKGINLPGANLSLPALSEQDRKDLYWGIDHDMEYVAVSFVKNRRDILEVRKLIEDRDSQMKVIAKIETRQGVDNIQEIIEVVDGIMVARGDLGVEIYTEEVPLVQKKLISLCIEHGKPVIVATQMLDSMIRNPRPTRAEASDVANAVLDGTDAVMLSGETAKGKYPLESVQMMNTLIMKTEAFIDIPESPSPASTGVSIADAVSQAAVTVARKMGVGAILSLTRTGSTARMVSKYRPPCIIIGSTPIERTWRELALIWGVSPILEEEPPNETQAVTRAILGSLSRGYIKEGEILAVTAGVPMGTPGTTNMLQLHTAGRILLRGIPYLKKEATGPVCLVRSGEDASKVKAGDIVVVTGTDRTFVPAISKAAGIITEQRGLTSHPAILALELGIPCVLGAENAMDLLGDGMIVTIDGGRGLVYQGTVRLHM